MEKTRDLFNKTGDTKGNFHTNIGIIKFRNGKDQQKQKKIKKG